MPLTDVHGRDVPGGAQGEIAVPQLALHAPPAHRRCRGQGVGEWGVGWREEVNLFASRDINSAFKIVVGGRKEI